MIRFLTKAPTNVLVSFPWFHFGDASWDFANPQVEPQASRRFQPGLESDASRAKSVDSIFGQRPPEDLIGSMEVNIFIASQLHGFIAQPSPPTVSGLGVVVPNLPNRMTFPQPTCAFPQPLDSRHSLSIWAT